MALSSDDFQKVATSLDDVARALRDNTAAILRGSGGAPAAGGGAAGASFGAGIAPVGGGAGAGGGGQKWNNKDDGTSGDAGFNLSAMGRLLTASSPATGSFGSGMGAILGATTPIGMAAGALGMVAGQMADRSQAQQSILAAGSAAQLGAAGAGETPYEARIRGQYAQEIEMWKQNAASNQEAATGWNPLSRTVFRKAHLDSAQLSTENAENATREEQDVVEPALRARRDVERRIGFGIDHGMMDTEKGQRQFWAQMQFWNHIEKTAQRGKRAEDMLIDQFLKNGGGAFPGQVRPHS